jgi:hypothetical protein
MPVNVFAVTEWLSTELLSIEWLSFVALLVQHELIGLAISATTVVVLFAQQGVNSLCVLWLFTRVKLSFDVATIILVKIADNIAVTGR